MDKKSILIGALGAALLFVSIGATYPEQEPKGVWEFHISEVVSSVGFSINTITGEVRYHDAYSKMTSEFFDYRVSKERSD